MQRTAVVYFSQTGHTANAAHRIHELVGGPLIKLQRQPAYPDDYTDLVAVAQRERDHQALPTLMPLTASLDDVDTVFLGFPSWWAQPPLVIVQFLATTPLTGKVIIPFTTSISSTIDESVPVLKRLTAQAGATLAPGLTANSIGDTDAFMAQFNV